MNSKNYAALIIAFVRFCISVLSFPPACILRKNMGERYCSYFKLILAILFVTMSQAGLAIIGSGIGNFSPNAERYAVTILNVFGIIVIVCFILNRIDIRERNKKGTKWHSLYMGDPRFFHNTVKWQKYGISGTVVLVGIGLLAASSWITPSPGLLIINMGIYLFFEYVLMEYQARNKFLDYVDAEIEASNLSAALKGESIANTEGFFIPNVIMQAERKREGENNLERMYANLDPSLKALIKHSK